jgi:hypothetical protein
MKFLTYEDVPLYLAVSGKGGEHVYAESASLSIEHNTAVTRQIEDNILRICEFGTGSTMNYVSPAFVADEIYTGVSGPSGGPPMPLSTSIFKIPSGTKITFPNGKHLYFNNNIQPEGHDYLIELRSESGGWSLTQGEAQSGYFEPIYNYATQSPIEGSLSVNFYINTGNLQSFFNVTGLSNPNQYPPIDEEKITGYLGDFVFSDAYLTSFNFGLSPNSISQASASFKVYGTLQKDSSVTSNYYSSSIYEQQSIAHGQDSTVIGSSDLGLSHVTSFNYSINVDRSPRYSIPTGSSQSDVGLVPDRVSKKSTIIQMSIEGENLDPDILVDGFNGKRANLKASVRDLNYDWSEENANGFMHEFECSGVVKNQNLSVGSAGYLNGSISVEQYVK